MNTTARNRLTLLAVVALFALPLLAAWLLNVMGWHPTSTRNHGDLIEPPVDISAAPVTLSDGSRLAWRDAQWQWTLVALQPSACADACQARLGELMRMRITLNRNAERLRVVYLGQPLPPALLQSAKPLQQGRDDGGNLAGYLPDAQSDIALVLVDPNGLLMLRYAPGYSVGQVREDLIKLLH